MIKHAFLIPFVVFIIGSFCSCKAESSQEISLSALDAPQLIELPDRDNDGLPDGFDQCPNSKSTAVDENGCESQLAKKALPLALHSTQKADKYLSIQPFVETARNTKLSNAVSLFCSAPRSHHNFYRFIYHKIGRFLTCFAKLSSNTFSSLPNYHQLFCRIGVITY